MSYYVEYASAIACRMCAFTRHINAIPGLIDGRGTQFCNGSRQHQLKANLDCTPTSLLTKLLLFQTLPSGAKCSFSTVEISNGVSCWLPYGVWALFSTWGRRRRHVRWAEHEGRCDSGTNQCLSLGLPQPCLAFGVPGTCLWKFCVVLFASFPEFKRWHPTLNRNEITYVTSCTCGKCTRREVSCFGMPSDMFSGNFLIYLFFWFPSYAAVMWPQKGTCWLMSNDLANVQVILNDHLQNTFFL